MSKEKYNHTYIGQIYDISIRDDGTYADIILQGKDAITMPLMHGQFIILEINKDQSFLARLEGMAPDFEENKLALKSVLRMKSSKKVEDVDPTYRKKEGINYRAKVLGVCYEEKNKFKFYTNIRAFPSIFDLKVAIPDPEYMKKIAQTSVQDSDNDKEKAVVEIGTLCYGSLPEYTNKYYDPNDPKKRVPIYFNTTNLFRKRTGIFGASGSGKSNSVKTMIGSLRAKHPNSGLLLLDTNGEYALDNTQNDGLMDILKDAGMTGTYSLYTGRKISQGKIDEHGKDAFKPLKFDAFTNIKPSFEIILSNLQGASIQYLNAWTTEIEGEENPNKFFHNFGDTKGLIWAIWYSCLEKAGLSPVQKNHPYQDMVLNRTYMMNHYFKQVIFNQYKTKYGIETEEELAVKLTEKYGDSFTFEKIFKGMSDQNKENFNKEMKSKGIFLNLNSYRTKNIQIMIEYAKWKLKSIEDDSDSSLKEFKRLYDNPRRLTALKAFHLKSDDNKVAPTSSLGELVWQDLKNNKMVILDLASIPIRVAKSLSAHILSYLLEKSSGMFGDTSKKKSFENFEALIFIEEAQNYLGPEEIRQGSIYERIAKEGRKFHIGLCYITQQPSAIDQSITSQTENIIALHMGSFKDTQVLNQINDKFDLLTCKFIKDEVKKGLAYFFSKPYQPFVLPVQMHLFTRDYILKNKK